MIGVFEEILSEVGKIFHLKLHVDQNHACSILIPPLIIQLQPDTSLEKLFLFCKISELPPGKFRENILASALKANRKEDPRAGILGYIASTNTLSLHQTYPFSILSGERLAHLISGFLEMAMIWYKAVQSGNLPQEEEPVKSPPPFGIKP